MRSHPNGFPFSFYANRALRVLPLFLIVVVLTDIAAPFVLPTMAIAWDFIPSAATAPVSNFTFLLTQGYFDISGIEKPLLHTWTLSVEEQFYFWAPILLVLVFWIGNLRFGRLAAAIGQTICRPFAQNVVLFSDTHHVLSSGADRIFDTFRDDFLWLAGKGGAR